MTTNGNGFQILWRQDGALERLRYGAQAFEPVLGRSFFEIDGIPASARPLPEGGGYRLVAQGADGPPRSAGQAESAVTPHSGRLQIAAGHEVSLLFESAAAPAPAVQRIGLCLGLPPESEIHLAEYYNVGRRLDGEMPVGESYEGKLAYGFLVAGVAGMWIRFRVARPSMNGAHAHIVRLPSMLSLTIRWQPPDPLRILPFPSLDEATRDFASRLEADFGIRKLRHDPASAAWVRDTRLVLCIDMMRSNGEISHDYGDVIGMCDDLRGAGCPENTVLYIPGWQGRYDAVHPTYRPAEALGGESGFRAMMDAARGAGYRVMIHTTGWGIDPYHPDIDNLLKLARIDENGRYEGWQIGYTRRPPRQDLGFVTPWIAVPGAGGAPGGRVQIKTPPSPSECEALFSIGGLEGCTARAKLCCGERSVSTPPGWFADHGEYDFPFPLLLHSGENAVQLSFSEGQVPQEGFRYRIRYSFIPESPYSPWTWPILRADTSHPHYVSMFVKNVSGVVKEFGIDAVHVDATTLGWPPGVRKLFYGLRDALPGIPINTELYTEFEGLGYWSFSQNATQSLMARRAPPEEQQSLPMRCGLPEHFAWLDKPSGVCDFAREYIRTYPHLCAINAFVPVGKVCNTFPARLMPARIEEHWRVLRDAGRLGYLPALRLNYRAYGLDRETLQAITELTQG